MIALSRDELKALSVKRSGACVSIFMPAHPSGAEARQDPIRFRNLLRDAEHRLLADGMRLPAAKQLLAPAVSLMEDTYFWQRPGDGLALFVAPDALLNYRLPLAFEELVVIGHRFHIKPLVPLLIGDERFYVLALSLNGVKLFQATRYSISEVEVSNMPAGMAEALKYDEPEKQIRFRAAAPVGAGRMAAMFYSSGDGVDDAKQRIVQYFHQVDDSLRPMLGDERAPLVLAGVDYLLPIYREANKYSHLMSEGITGNPDDLGNNELHRRAWAILQPHFQKRQVEADMQYRQLAGGRRASKQLRAVVHAAYHGRVSVLFVAARAQQWGTFDPETDAVHVRLDEMKPGDEDLLDFAAIHTLLNGGTVYAVEPEQMPDDTPLAAVFRY